MNSLSNLPDSVRAGDPDAPWNQADAEPRHFVFEEAIVIVEALSQEDAEAKLAALKGVTIEDWERVTECPPEQ